VAGVCQASAVTGLETVRCPCRDLLPASCAGLLIPPRAGVLVTRSCSLFDKADETRAGVRRLKRGARLLRRAATIVTRAGTSGRLADGCASLLAARLTELRTRAQGLAGGR
jgi:hypothetical protein